MITSVCFIIVIISLLRLSLVLRVDAGVDILKNAGYFRVRLFRITLFKGIVRFQIQKRYGVFVLSWGNKTKEIHLTVDANDEDSLLNIIAPSFISSFVPTSVAVEITAGKKNDAFFTAFVISGIRVAVCSLLSAVKSKSKCKAFDRYLVKYNQDALKIAVSGIFQTNLANIIYEIAKDLITRKKGGEKIDSRT